VTESDLSRIESSLQVRLPQDYRQLALNHPIRAEHGTIDGNLWDDATALIEWNLKYRAGFAGLKPWPDHFYLIGDDGAASTYALDLRASPSPVFMFDHGSPDAMFKQAETCRQWMDAFLEEMKASGEDPDAERPPPISLSKVLLLALLTAVAAAVVGRIIWYVIE
jgi:hypothetical protein